MNANNHSDEDTKKRTTDPVVVGGIVAIIIVCLVGFVLINQVFPLRRLIPGATGRPQTSPAPGPTLKVEEVPSPTSIPTLSPRPTMVDYSPLFEPTECEFPIPEGASVDCGYVVVPEDRYSDANDTIRLAVAVYHAKGDIPENIPVIYLQGGPGSDAISSMNDVYSLLIDPVLQNGDFIVFDQRGVGLSQPNLDCPDLKTVYMEDLTHQVSTSERIEKYEQAFSLCKQQLESQGISLSSYNTLESAADVKDIISSLGYQKATLFGTSYGTRLAQVVMREFPETVHSAVLDSVLPVDVKKYNQGSATSETALRTLFDSCAADPDCSSLYPNFEQDFWELVSRLDAQPKWVTVHLTDSESYNRSVDGLSFLNAIIWALREPGLIPEIPQLVYRVRAGETSFLGVMMVAPSVALNDTNIGAYLSINCREQVYSTTPEELLENLESHPDTDELGLAWIYGDPEFVFSLCDAWQVNRPYIDEMIPVDSDVPVLLLAGQFDSTTPPSYAAQVAESLSQSKIVEFPGQGHGVTFSNVSNCPREVLFSFLREPEESIDTSCVDSMEEVSFSTPYTGQPPLELTALRDSQDGIVTKIPTHWEKRGEGFYIRNLSGWDMTRLEFLQTRASVDTWLSWLMENYASEGLDSYPLKTSDVEANGMVWKLYESTFRGYPVDLALAQNEFQTILVAMLSHVDEHEALYQTVFLEVIKETTSLR